MFITAGLMIQNNLICIRFTKLLAGDLSHIKTNPALSLKENFLKRSEDSRQAKLSFGQEKTYLDLCAFCHQAEGHDGAEAETDDPNSVRDDQRMVLQDMVGVLHKQTDLIGCFQPKNFQNQVLRMEKENISLFFGFNES